MSSDVDWTSVVQALNLAIGAHQGGDYCGQAIVAAIIAAGFAYDASYPQAPTAGGSDLKSAWLFSWMPLVAEANRIVMLTGGASVPFSSATLGPISAALATAIATMQASPALYGADAVSDAQQLASAIAAKFALVPSMYLPNAGAPAPSPQKVALLALLERATQYSAFLGGGA